MTTVLFDSTIPGMRTIFLADAHLRDQADDNYRLLLGFLKELTGNTDALYLMGDLFDFWVGFPSNPFRQYDEVLNALDEMVAAGCRLIYFEGNHDFHLGEIFTQRLKAEIHTSPIIDEVQGKRLYLCHGDQINRDDYGYRLLRLLLHNPLTGAAIRFIPLSLAEFIKEKLQQTSRSKYHQDSSRWDYRAIIREFARETRQSGCTALVTGHFHLAFIEQLDNSDFTILSLGDWMAQLTYGEMLDGELSLKCYSPTTS